MPYRRHYQRQLTIAAIGDAASGKTELLQRYTLNAHYYKHFPGQRFETNVREIVVDYAPYEVEFIDCEVDEDYFLLRCHAYEKASVILLCYTIARRQSFDNAMHKWCVEVRKINPDVPIVLVATGTETRRHQSNVPQIVSFVEGDNMRCAIKAAAFVECSVQQLVGIDDVFIEAVRSTCGRR